ncbi:MAG: hypothetical protein OEU32_12590 [Acidimicrobiia bacterium]|nr:hypothetical protein [Acidimicrobiia bacterium]
MTTSRRDAPLIAALLIGVGLIVAPFVFQMFTRAPEGASMIEDFRPYMTPDQVEEFRGYLVEIDAAEAETTQALRPVLAEGGVDYDATYPSAATLNSTWEAIDTDMTDLLDRMDANIDNFAAVDALPSFELFPWFFVLPGIILAVLAVLALRARSAGRDGRGLLVTLAVVGVALVLAPAVFQMFSRAPQGGDMIDSFRPMMTRERVQDVQGYFITLGASEGELRNVVVPTVAEAAGYTPAEATTAFPATSDFSADWPTIVTDFAPMIAAMSDNVDNYEAVDALPPFALFPWFFVIPGVLVVVLALVSARRPEPVPIEPDHLPTTQGTET